MFFSFHQSLLFSSDDNEDEPGPSNRTTDVDDDESFVPVQLAIPSSSTSLGDWEQHTRGVGSRLMAAMGYVTGRGLGKEGEGRVLPVPATVYPQVRRHQ